MRLRLQHPPTPAFAPTHAQIAVEAARDIDHVDLDYSPGSLADVDRILGRFHAEGLTADEMGETVFSFGCYVGEVLVRNNGGKWVTPRQTTMSKLGFGQTSMMIVKMPNGDVWNPIGKAFKLLENGEADSLAYFYRVATQADA